MWFTHENSINIYNIIRYIYTHIMYMINGAVHMRPRRDLFEEKNNSMRYIHLKRNKRKIIDVL